jgi:hypothetical protein
MDKPFDLLVTETRDKIINTINKSGLPITVTSLILSEITRAVNTKAEQTVSILKKRKEVK